MHVTYSISDLSEFQLSYSRRVQRPDIDDLNPFPEYRDPRDLRVGNPLLMPEYIHSVECGAKFQNDLFSVMPSIYYRLTSNRFTSVVTALNDTTLLTTRENLSSGQSAGLEVIVSYSPGPVLTAYASLNTYLDQIDAGNLGFGMKKSVVTWTGAITMSITAVRGTILQINANYRSVRLTPQGEYKPRYVVNFGARHELLKSRLAVTVTVANLFRSLKRELTLDTPQLIQRVLNRRDSGIMYLGLSYRFGRMTDEAKEDQLEFDNGI